MKRFNRILSNESHILFSKIILEQTRHEIVFFDNSTAKWHCSKESCNDKNGIKNTKLVLKIRKFSLQP